jgi:peptide/nickel transport system permease protein
MIIKRIGIGLLILVAVSMLLFAATEILPGDLAQIRLGQEATPETLNALRKQLGLDRPATIRYFEWFIRMCRLDPGESLFKEGGMAGAQTVRELIADRLQNTLLLSCIVAGIAVPIALILGLLAAMFPTSIYDRTITFVTMCLMSVPDFFLATVLILVFTVSLGWLPSIVTVTSYKSVGHMLYVLALPIVTLCLKIFGQIARMTRAAVLNVMSSPYIEMAILKGLPRKYIILKHALPNVISPIVNVIAICIAYLVSGVVIVEAIFGFPGIANLMVNSVHGRDMPVVQACGMIICTAYVLFILAADILSILSNPRLRHPK